MKLEKKPPNDIMRRLGVTVHVNNI